MSGWRLAVLILLLIGSYWGYSVDLECQLQHCISQHAEEGAGCSAPAKTVDPPLVLLCPEFAPVVTLPRVWPVQTKALVCRRACWPRDPEYVREVGPPRAPPSAA